MKNSEEIVSLQDLKRQIRIIESEVEEKERILRRKAEQLMESIRPSTIIKTAVAGTVPFAIPLLQKGIASGAVGFVAKKIFNRFSKRKKILT